MKPKKYKNPVLSGFHADPSICRVEEDYYLVTSSFEYFPGIPVYHSRDLVNWEQIGNCISFENSIDLKSTSESGGIWAATIRYSEGIFYVTTAMWTNDAKSPINFIIHAKNPAGPWSVPVLIPVGGIDPSIIFDDGRAYYCTNDHMGADEETIVLGEIDALSGKILRPFRPIWHGTGGGWLEAPHITKGAA